MQLVSKQSINSSRNCSINETKTALTTHITLWQQLSFDRANQRPPIWMDDPTSKSLEDYLPPNRCQSSNFNFFYIVKINQIKASHQQLKSNSVLNSKLLTGSYPRLIPWVDLDKKLQPSKKRILTNRLPPLSTIKDCLKQTLICNFRSMKMRACLRFFPNLCGIFLQLWR